MKKTTLILTTAMAASLVSAESVLKPINDQGFGTFSGRIRSLTMYRDFDAIPAGNTGANSTLGIILNYTTPELAGFDAGVGYNYAGEIYQANNTAILANEPIHVLNEGWIRYNFGSLNMSNTTVYAGRKINNAEVFRADDVRQKSRSIQAIEIESKDIAHNKVNFGHANKMSNWVQKGDLAYFNNFGDVFKSGTKTDGITWAELVNNNIDGLEVALFDAYAWDVANLIGTRAAWAITDGSTLLGYYRNENDVGDMAVHNSDVYGLSFRQNVGPFTLEPGYFGVRGDSLKFQETTTGINHPLGSSMMIYSGQFLGGADTAYLKATTKIESTKTAFYALYNYTWHDIAKYNGQEFNLVITQPIVDNLTMALKGGIGQKDWFDGTKNTLATDVRLFLTYTF